MMEKRKTKNDIILIVVVLLVAAVLLAVYAFTAKDGQYVVVTISGEEVSRYSLSENIKTDILSDGEAKNTLVIENGEAYVTYANCPDKICVSHRKISHDGESIICLPHKLVVSVEAS